MESRFFAGLSDDKYLEFSKRLIATGYPMEGVRLPLIKQAAKALKNNAAFLDTLPVTYEEVMLYGFVLANSDFDIEQLLKRVDAFLPWIDNWAVCDCTTAALKKLGKHKQRVLEHFSPLKNSPNVFDRRFLAVLLMGYYFTDEYIDPALKILLQINTGEYYVDMAVAWALATAAAKYFDKAYAIISGGTLSPFILKKSISKSIESYRLSSEQKDMLRALRAKG